MNEDWDELYGEKGRRGHRLERKIAQRTDRSFSKKSDQDQKKKQQIAQESSDSSQLEGLVIALSAGRAEVMHGEQLYLCSTRGQLREQQSRTSTLLVVGDLVFFTPFEGSFDGVITQIKPRRSLLARADNLSRRRQQLIAANIDLVLIAASVVSPPLKVPLIDRYILAAQKEGMQPVVVVNKVDLLGSEPSQEKELLEEVKQVYKALNIPLFVLSCEERQGIEDLALFLSGKSCVISGQSGVGKSSLLSALTGKQLATGSVVEQTRKGSHTTTTARLLPLPCGGSCIDTPGIRSFGMWELKQEEVRTYFSEIFEESCRCRFRGCTHLTEPDCAVQKALDEDRISLLRFASYCALIASCTTRHRIR